MTSLRLRVPAASTSDVARHAGAPHFHSGRAAVSRVSHAVPHWRPTNSSHSDSPTTSTSSGPQSSTRRCAALSLQHEVSTERGTVAEFDTTRELAHGMEIRRPKRLPLVPAQKDEGGGSTDSLERGWQSCRGGMDVRGRDHNKASSSLIGASAIHGRSSQLPRPITVDVAGGQDDRLPMGAIVEALMRLEWTATAGEVLDQYTAQMEGRALNSLISSLGKRHRPWLSLRVFRWAQVARPELVNRIHHNNLISIMGRHKQYGAALQVFEELRQRSGGCLQEEGDGGGPDAFSYTAVITACAYAGKWQTAAHWFRHMEEERLRPNRYTYNALLCAYEKGGQWEQAEAVLQEMIKIGGSAAPDAVSYNSVMAACNRGGQRIQALKVAAAMASAGLDADTVTFNTLIDVHGREGSWVEARRLVKEMKERGVGRDTVTYTSAIVACGRAKQAAAALEVFEEMAMDGVAPNTFTYNALITALTRGEMWERALALSSSMAPASISGQAIPASSTSGRQPRRDAITYTALITACAAGGQAAKAAALLHSLAMHSATNKKEIVQLNAIPSLVRLVNTREYDRETLPSGEHVRLAASTALLTLSVGSPANEVRIREAGGPSRRQTLGGVLLPGETLPSLAKMLPPDSQQAVYKRTRGGRRRGAGGAVHNPNLKAPLETYVYRGKRYHLPKV
mmetsp:Transcript_26691/g.58114  ORF Transcript_26691/g.58114 Transcript_26691/m.58114 type:complete len:681 (-) Transcript_26691:295-2337(-)